MFTLNVKSNLAGVRRQLQGFEKEVAAATAKALTFTAEAVQAAEVEKMKAVFDRPTPYTLKSLYKKTATRTDLVASVYFKDPPTGQHYLKVQVDGGDRPQRRSEQRLSAWMFGYRYLMPGGGAPVDGYGNMRGSVYTQIMSQLGALDPHDNRTAKSAKRQAKAQTAQYFVSKPGGHLVAGIYKRGGKGHVKPILIFTSKAHYKPRFPFYTYGLEVAQRVFPDKFDKAIDAEMRKAFASKAPLS